MIADNNNNKTKKKQVKNDLKLSLYLRHDFEREKNTHGIFLEKEMEETWGSAEYELVALFCNNNTYFPVYLIRFSQRNEAAKQ